MPHFPSQACRFFALFFCVALAGCASLDKYSFETFGRPKQPPETYATKARSDELALIYADYVALLLEGRSTGARVTREISDSTLAVGGAFLAATETLEISAETVAGIGVGAVIIRELQKIFSAGGRSEAFADAAYLIRQAQSEYRQYNPNPSPDRLTENGAILVSRVDAAVHAARKSMNGRMPGLLDLKQATQPMTRDGARRESSGTPQTIFTASGELPVLRGPREPEPGKPDPKVGARLALLGLRNKFLEAEAKVNDPLPMEVISMMDALDPDPDEDGVETPKYPRTKKGLHEFYVANKDSSAALTTMVAAMPK
jgi:hypothetical protein